MGNKVAILRSAANNHRGYITAEMRQYQPSSDEPQDAKFILINHGLNDLMTREEVISFAMGLLELTNVLETEKFLKELKI